MSSERPSGSKKPDRYTASERIFKASPLPSDISMNSRACMDVNDLYPKYWRFGTDLMRKIYTKKLDN